ncbi:hypothetical protein GJW-30_1_03153 [Variibacter gotjawalensis]|uniref:Uncharacterized protein n=1 Tax=Variibacter gotjawalensis TaxID=1333996 RepID=A0A0S3PXF9_9BRAD|nr:hypothetical protein [Variibacter gotjawalensis]NIK46435.1 hypothetical protein [Variibacter gotjawalensis]RZS48345.1 hypothetical protein EV661_0755 [Variibacter gotjawalensis]BAT60605.1 hypothetical protein GJW-30_1_03153 [Variibacter gotjawalensis]
MSDEGKNVTEETERIVAKQMELELEVKRIEKAASDFVANPELKLDPEQAIQKLQAIGSDLAKLKDGMQANMEASKKVFERADARRKELMDLEKDTSDARIKMCNLLLVAHAACIAAVTTLIKEASALQVLKGLGWVTWFFVFGLMFAGTSYLYICNDREARLFSVIALKSPPAGHIALISRSMWASFMCLTTPVAILAYKLQNM